MLAERMAKHKVDCWLVNTGWTRGKYGTGSRCPLKYTRRIIDAIHSGELAKAEYENFGTFNLSIPTGLEGVPIGVVEPEEGLDQQGRFREGGQEASGYVPEGVRSVREGRRGEGQIGRASVLD
jgi:phosphoenolpyruvate carboxykinase (ATP)